MERLFNTIVRDDGHNVHPVLSKSVISVTSVIRRSPIVKETESDSHGYHCHGQRKPNLDAKTLGTFIVSSCRYRMGKNTTSIIPKVGRVVWKQRDGSLRRVSALEVWKGRSKKDKRSRWVCFEPSWSSFQPCWCRYSAIYKIYQCFLCKLKLFIWYAICNLENPWVDWSYHSNFCVVLRNKGITVNFHT